MKKVCVSILALLMSNLACAESQLNELFGIPLGMTTTKTVSQPVGDMPVDKLTGIIPWRFGARYYFEPQQISDEFPLTRRMFTGDGVYRTSYSSLVLPVIPEGIESFEDWTEASKTDGEKFVVMSIEFNSDELDSVDAARNRVLELCNQKAIEVGFDPVKTVVEPTSRQCWFEEGDRVLAIESYGKKFVYRLKYSDEFIDEANAALKEQVNKLRNSDPNNSTLADSH